MYVWWLTSCTFLSNALGPNPSGVAASPNGCQSLQVTWTHRAPTSPLTLIHYRLRYQPQGGSQQTVTSTSQGSYTLTGLVPATTYTVIVDLPRVDVGNLVAKSPGRISDAVTQGRTPPPSSHGSCKPIDEYRSALRRPCIYSTFCSVVFSLSACTQLQIMLLWRQQHFLWWSSGRCCECCAL